MVQKLFCFIVKHPLVSIILVNWNGKLHLKRCLESLERTTYGSKEIIVVDNASTDGSAQWIRDTYKNIRILQNNQNFGFAGGHDAGIGVARGIYVLLLNVDTILEQPFLEPLVNVLERDRSIGVVQPKVVLDANRSLLDSIGSFLIPNGLLYHYGREKDEALAQYNISMDIFTAKGVCMLIRREVIDRVGLFDKDFFSYFEETDFCMRVWLGGWRVRYEPTSRIVHVGGASSSQKPSSFILYHASKNVICAYIKNLSPLYALRVIPSVVGLYCAWVLINIVTGKFLNAGAIVAAVGWNIVHLGETMRKRRYIQDVIRTRSDRTFLPRLMRSIGLRYYMEQFFGSLGRYRDIEDIATSQTTAIM